MFLRVDNLMSVCSGAQGCKEYDMTYINLIYWGGVGVSPYLVDGG